MAGSSILLVDDDRGYCAAMTDVLSELGYPVDSACDGPTALALSRLHPFVP